MKVKEFIDFLKTIEGDTEVCVIENGGQGYGVIAFEVKPKIIVIRSNGSERKIVAVN